MSRIPSRDWPDDTLGIYLITREEETVSYDEAAGFVVAAIDEESARTLIADIVLYGDEGEGPWLDSRRSTALMVGRSLPGDTSRIVLRDFRAG